MFFTLLYQHLYKLNLVVLMSGILDIRRARHSLKFVLANISKLLKCVKWKNREALPPAVCLLLSSAQFDSREVFASARTHFSCIFSYTIYNPSHTFISFPLCPSSFCFAPLRALDVVCLHVYVRHRLSIVGRYNKTILILLQTRVEFRAFKQLEVTISSCTCVCV